jgi:hypothetical protein
MKKQIYKYVSISLLYISCTFYSCAKDEPGKQVPDNESKG